MLPKIRIRRTAPPKARIPADVQIKHWMQINKSSVLLKAAVRFALSVAAILLVFGIAHGAKQDMPVSMKQGIDCFGCPGTTLTDWREGTRELEVREINWNRTKEQLN